MIREVKVDIHVVLLLSVNTSPVVVNSFSECFSCFSHVLFFTFGAGNQINNILGVTGKRMSDTIFFLGYGTGKECIFLVVLTSSTSLFVAFVWCLCVCNSGAIVGRVNYRLWYWLTNIFVAAGIYINDGIRV